MFEDAFSEDGKYYYDICCKKGIPTVKDADYSKYEAYEAYDAVKYGEYPAYVRNACEYAENYPYYYLNYRQNDALVAVETCKLRANR